LDGQPIAPKESPARNPAFDVTPAKYITGFITELGIRKPGELRTLGKPARPKKKSAKKAR
jgi:methylthioribose-1-phosphate isomerase